MQYTCRLAVGDTELDVNWLCEPLGYQRDPARWYVQQRVGVPAGLAGVARCVRVPAGCVEGVAATSVAGSAVTIVLCDTHSSFSFTLFGGGVGARAGLMA